MDTPSTRSKIIQSAIKILASDGVRGFSVLQVAKKSQLSRQMVHRYFDDGDHLMTECFKSVREKFRQDATEALQGYKKPLEILEHYVAFTFKWMEKELSSARVLFLFLQSSFSDKKLRKFNTEFVNMGTERIWQMLQSLDISTTSKSLDMAKAIQNVLTGGLICIMSEDQDPQRICHITFLSIKKLLDI